MLDQKKYIHFIEINRKAYPVLQKEEGVQKWTRIVVKSAKKSATVQKDYD